MIVLSLVIPWKIPPNRPGWSWMWPGLCSKSHALGFRLLSRLLVPRPVDFFLFFFDGSRIGGFHRWRAIEWMVCNGKSYEHGWFGRSPILGNLLWAKKRNTGQLAVITNKNHELVSVIPRDGGFSVPYLKSREASNISCKASWCISLAKLMVYDGTTY